MSLSNARRSDRGRGLGAIRFVQARYAEGCGRLKSANPALRASLDRLHGPGLERSEGFVVGCHRQSPAGARREREAAGLTVRSTYSHPDGERLGTDSMKRLAVLTGAAGDIGGAAARELAADGWSLVLCDHPSQRERLGSLRASLPDLPSDAGRSVSITEFDVTDAAAVADAFARIETDLGTPLAVFNNAGIQGQFARIDEYPVEDV